VTTPALVICWRWKDNDDGATISCVDRVPAESPVSR
jgi:hypothetical protein